MLSRMEVVRYVMKIVVPVCFWIHVYILKFAFGGFVGN